MLEIEERSETPPSFAFLELGFRRFFIERCVDEAFQARNRRWVDIGSMVLFLLWAVIDVFFPQTGLVGGCRWCCSRSTLCECATGIRPASGKPLYGGRIIWGMDGSCSVSCSKRRRRGQSSHRRWRCMPSPLAGFGRSHSP